MSIQRREEASLWVSRVEHASYPAHEKAVTHRMPGEFEAQKECMWQRRLNKRGSNRELRILWANPKTLVFICLKWEVTGRF